VDNGRSPEVNQLESVYEKFCHCGVREYHEEQFDKMCACLYHAIFIENYKIGYVSFHHITLYNGAGRLFSSGFVEHIFNIAWGKLEVSKVMQFCTFDNYEPYKHLYDAKTYEPYMGYIDELNDMWIMEVALK